MLERENRNKIIVIAVAAFLFITVAAILYVNFGEIAAKSGEAHVIDVYYLNASTTRLEKEVRNIKGEDKVEALRDVLRHLMEGPRSSNLSRSIPNSVGIQGVLLINGNIAQVNFTKEYNDMADIEEVFCRSALVWTLTELDFIDSVIINVESETLKRSDGSELGVLNRDNIVMNPDISHTMRNAKTVTLYFSDEQAMYLLPEERRIDINPEHTIEKHVVEQLIAGTEIPNRYSPIPPESRLRDIKTIESVCYVDFNKEFIDRQSGSSTEARLIIYSIVNSLAEVPGVRRVVFHMEGQRIVDYKGGIDLSVPVDPDPSIIFTEESD